MPAYTRQSSKGSPSICSEDVLEQEKTNKKDIFNTKVAGTWFEGKQVYPKQEAVW